MTATLKPERDLHFETLGDYEARVLFPEPRPVAREMRYATVFSAKKPLALELGGSLAPVRVAYTTYGTLNEARDNAVVVCHALTGSAVVGGASGWWSELIGEGQILDTNKDFVICANVLGGCYGTTGPTSPDPSSSRDYGPGFPEITVGDMVRVQAALLEVLGVRHVRVVVGGSMGGMQVLEWLHSYPNLVGAGVVIGAPARHSAWALALYHLSRQAIQNDPDFRSGRYAAQPKGLALAREIATISYRSPASFEITQARRPSKLDPKKFAMQTYLEHQGEKLLERFDANSYLSISRALDRFDLTDAQLAEITQPVLCVGISSDCLYLPHEVKHIGDTVQNGEYVHLESVHGHDAFLIEMDKLEPSVREFLSRV